MVTFTIQLHAGSAQPRNHRQHQLLLSDRVHYRRTDHATRQQASGGAIKNITHSRPYC